MRFFDRRTQQSTVEEDVEGQGYVSGEESQKAGSDLTTKDADDDGMEVGIEDHESYAASQYIPPAAARKRDPKTNIMYCVAISVLILAIIGLSVGVGVSTRRRNTQTRDFGGIDRAPTAAPLSDEGVYLLEILTEFTPETILKNDVFAQGLAFDALLAAEQSAAEPTDPRRVIQRYALLNLYYSTAPDGWHNSFGWNEASEDECQWLGVDTCRFMEAGNYLAVANLHVNSNNLVGTIPTELCLLGQSVENLDLGDNMLMLSIPECIMDFVNMEGFILRENQLTGPIPSGLLGLEPLSAVDLGVNQLSGDLDRIIADDPLAPNKLQVLLLDSNELTGTVPAVFEEFSLLSLAVSNNNLSGSVNHLCDSATASVLVDCFLECDCCTTVDGSANERFDMEYCEVN